MPLILLTNDDGVMAPGLEALRLEVSKIADVIVVAPDRERSASSHALTIHKPLKVQQHDRLIYSLNGTPTDCVAIAIAKILPQRPDLVLSGINSGPNLGDDITYSGTVAAAMEGTINNIPSIAVSVNSHNSEYRHFRTAATVAAKIARFILEKSLPVDTLLNINVPNLPLSNLKGIRFTRQGKRVYDGSIQDTRSPWGEGYYWIGGGTPYWDRAEDTDISCVEAGYVSITPIHLDLTNYQAMEFISGQWENWNTHGSES